MSISDDTDAAARGADPSRDGGDPRSGELAVHRFHRPGLARLHRLALAVSLGGLLVALLTWALAGGAAAVGALVVATALAAALWLAWFGEPACAVRVEYGALVVVEGDREHRVDVAGADLEVVSAPGRRGWKVLVRRPGRRVLVIDGAMVDADELTRVLGRWRPDLLGAPPDDRRRPPRPDAA
ncbi:hypothetical protein GCM10009737_16000 [Nocardioides lentus]|uniref:PH domain-containing protein n=1 Tax=Nocardioides lentus TaxID=338077 RepID=A0ABN2PA13_9ACTN